MRRVFVPHKKLIPESMKQKAYQRPSETTWCHCWCYTCRFRLAKEKYTYIIFNLLLRKLSLISVYWSQASYNLLFSIHIIPCTCQYGMEIAYIFYVSLKTWVYYSEIIFPCFLVKYALNRETRKHHSVQTFRVLPDTNLNGSRLKIVSCVKRSNWCEEWASLISRPLAFKE